MVFAFAVGAAALASPLAGAPPANVGVAAKTSPRAGAPWTTVVTVRGRRPAVIARQGVTTLPVSARSLGRSRYRLRITFPFSGRWELRSGGRRIGAVSVRPAPPLVSALPGAHAFRLCGGSGAPYQQYAISLEPSGGALWAACREQSRLLRIDPASGETRAILRLRGARPTSIAAGLGAVWSADRSSSIYRIDLRTGRNVPVFSGTGFSYLWTAAASVWAHDDDARRLVRYDPVRRRTTAELTTGDGTSALVEESGHVWIVNHRDGTLERIDPAINVLTRLARLPGDAPERMVFAAGSLWVTGRGTDLLRVDPATGAVQATIEVGAGAIDLRAAGGSIWVAAPTAEEDLRGNPFLDRLLRVDPASNAVVETIRPARAITVTGTASSGSDLWLADNVHGRLYRLTR